VARTKSILVLGRRDATEAMRVAAGLTIFDHTVHLIFMIPVADTSENTQNAEALELMEIEAGTTVPGERFTFVDLGTLMKSVLDADEVVNI
jgi:hypothetical protein